MDMERYLANHGPPPMDISWGYREIGKGSDAPEPAILIDCTVKLTGYGDFIYDTFGVSEELRLVWTPVKQGWYIDPVLGNQVLPPPIIAFGFSPHGWKAALEERRRREMTTLWKCGCPVLLRVRDDPKDYMEASEALLFDKFDSYGLLDAKRTQEMMFKLREPEYPFGKLQYWATAGMDS